MDGVVKEEDEDEDDEAMKKFMSSKNRIGDLPDYEALLENGDELYEGEFRRCAGLENEEAFLGVLGCIQGQWGSRRRRTVSPCEFSDWLPIGWKLLPGLKRKEGWVSVYCCRYISDFKPVLINNRRLGKIDEAYSVAKTLATRPAMMGRWGR
ncbi:hypothetical protein Vadar_012245 [Vaccinium darrowii]|uniref:Uncharacterized protein n=1 Tax=Vaccinium darrowii TaxID=229202 RepID=A0ACB7XYM4_9ERIC|nr:hypothetical protein Vadar_012245 [Vaccinium darrowii]